MRDVKGSDLDKCLRLVPRCARCRLSECCRDLCDKARVFQVGVPAPDKLDRLVGLLSAVLLCCYYCCCCCRCCCCWYCFVCCCSLLRVRRGRVQLLLLLLQRWRLGRAPQQRAAVGPRQRFRGHVLSARRGDDAGFEAQIVLHL